MKDFDKILIRLVEILSMLSKGSSPKIKELAKHFNVTERTIQRDVYQRLMYFPIEKNSKGELKLIDGFSLDETILSNKELLFTYLILSKIKNINPALEKDIYDIVRKLLKINYNPTYHKYTEINTFVNDEVINTIKEAIRNRNILDVQLSNKSVKIKPFKLVDSQNKLLLLAEDFEDNNIKSLCISKIENIEINKKRYKIRKHINDTLNDVHPSWFKSMQSFKVQIEVHKKLSYQFKLNDILASQKIISENQNGSLIIEFVVNDLDELKDVIKSWLPYIKVLHPEKYDELLSSEMEEYIYNIKK